MAPAERYRKRIPCAVHFRDAQRSGMVLNLSQSGLFVQTTVSASRGDDIDLVLNSSRSSSPIPVRAKIVWSRRVDPQFRSVVQGGFGARIEAASEDYFDMLQELNSPSPVAPRPGRAKPVGGAEKPVGDRYRVRVKLQGSPRSRYLTVVASSEQEAGQRALKEAGQGWSLLDAPVREPSATS